MKQFLIFIIGLPCSGKTSIAKAIKEKYSCVLFSTEQVRADIIGISKESRDCDFTPEQSSLVYSKILSEADSALANGASVVIDGVYRNREQRGGVFALAEKHSTAVKLYYHVTCEEKTAFDRLEKRKQSGTVAPAGVDGYKKIKLEFEHPDPTVFKTVDNTHSFTDSINTIIEDMEALL